MRMLMKAAAVLLAGCATAEAQTCPPSGAGTTAQRLRAVEACLARPPAPPTETPRLDALERTQAEHARDLADTRARADAAQVTANAAAGDVTALRARAAEQEDAIARILRDLALNDDDPPPVDAGAAEPNTADGRPIMQLGLNFISEADGYEPFLNHLATANAVPIFQKVPNRWAPATPDEAVRAGVINPVTLEPKSLGPFAAVNIGTVPCRATFVVEWEGDGDVDVVYIGGDKSRPGPRRLEFTAAPSARAGNCPVQITRINDADPVRNVRAYFKTDEARVRAGEVFSPQFLATARRYKVLRFMDWMHMNTNTARLASQVKPDTARHFGSAEAEIEALTGDVSLPLYGAPLGLQFRLAREADAAVWTNVPPYLGADPEGLRLTMTPSPEGVDNFALARARARATARQQIASAEWDRYADRIVAAMVAERYPLNRTLYVELSNEVWNWGPPFGRATNWYSGLGEGVFGGQWQIRTGYGYVSARVAEAITAALSRAGRGGQRWTLVLAGQTYNPDTTEQALIGYRRYFTDKGVDPAPWLARAGVAATSYYGGAFFPEFNGAFMDIARALNVKEATAPYRQAVLTEIKRDKAGATRRIADNIVAVQIPDLVNRWKQHAVIARRNGAQFIGDYEGGDSEIGFDFHAEKADPDYQALMQELRFGATGERLTRAWLEAWTKAAQDDPGAMIANFYGPTLNARPGRYGQAWDDGWYGEDNGRARGLEPYLRAAP